MEDTSFIVTLVPGQEVLIKKRHAKRLGLEQKAILNCVRANGMLSVRVTHTGQKKREANLAFDPNEIESCATLS